MVILLVRTPCNWHEEVVLRLPQQLHCSIIYIIVVPDMHGRRFGTENFRLLRAFVLRGVIIYRTASRLRNRGEVNLRVWFTTNLSSAVCGACLSAFTNPQQIRSTVSFAIDPIEHWPREGAHVGSSTWRLARTLGNQPASVQGLPAVPGLKKVPPSSGFIGWC